MSSSPAPTDEHRTAPPSGWTTTTARWAALVLVLSAAAWVVWLSWAVDRPALAPWQVGGAVATLLGAVVVGAARLGALATWGLVAVPFAAAGAWAVWGSDPLGPVGAVVWAVCVVLGVGALTALVTAARAGLRWRSVR